MSVGEAAAPWRGGHAGTRFGRHRALLAFVVGLIALALIALLVGTVAAPPAPTPPCPRSQLCLRPPPGRLPGMPAPRLVLGGVFTSPGLGYRIDYPSSDLSPSDVTPTSVVLAPPVSDPAFVMSVLGAPRSQADPRQLLDESLSKLSNSVPDIKQDNDPARQILAPALGGRAGVGGFYRGTIDSPSGLGDPVDVAILSATDGQETIAVTITIADRSLTQRVFQWLDSHVLETLRFRADVHQ